MSTNLFKQLRDVLGTSVLQVGDVLAVENGVATIELPGGAQVQARGEATVGDRVFFRDEVIEGPAPSLTYVEIDV